MVLISADGDSRESTSPLVSARSFLHGSKQTQRLAGWFCREATWYAKVHSDDHGGGFCASEDLIRTMEVKRLVHTTLCAKSRPRNLFNARHWPVRTLYDDFFWEDMIFCPCSDSQNLPTDSFPWNLCTTAFQTRTHPQYSEEGTKHKMYGKIPLNTPKNMARFQSESNI